MKVRIIVRERVRVKMSVRVRVKRKSRQGWFEKCPTVKVRVLVSEGGSCSGSASGLATREK